ncbi:MAG: ATP-dependent RNA helicase [Verrucomicrobiota bacterium]|jgi:ATP-dependent helicase HrpB|nr:ATP-dependent RNA helicase [Verrucomicrobiota bacterium]
MNQKLPIWDIHGEIIDSLAIQNCLVLGAPTGSGKSTQVPQMVVDDVLCDERKVIVLQPRRVAARSLARRVAWERSTTIGEGVGYQVRFEKHTTPTTMIEFITEGVLLRRLQNDPELKEVGAVLFDEFHERNLMSDLALGLIKKLQKNKRQELKIIIMSATIQTGSVASYLRPTYGTACPVLNSEGRTFPVDINFGKYRNLDPITEQAADAVEHILRNELPGDILIFMPGMVEIRSTIGAITRKRLQEPVDLIPLHGELPATEQDRAFTPSNHRKIIVATNVAETSVTIDGICHVIDSGLARVSRFDSERGFGTLLIEEISRASAEQRSGRAGRTKPGTCHRLWTESGHLNRPEYNTPEIHRKDLAEAVLMLHSAGINKASTFDWLEKPDATAVETAEELLRSLGALTKLTSNNSFGLTEIGKSMLKLPMHPRFARMMIEGGQRGCVNEAALCAAFLSGRNILIRSAREDKRIQAAQEPFRDGADSDFEVLIRAWQYAKSRHYNVDDCRAHGIHAGSCKEVETTFRQLIQLAKGNGITCNENTEPDRSKSTALRLCILSAFADQICIRCDTGTLNCKLPKERSGTLVRESVTQKSPLFIAAEIRQISTRGNRTKTLLSLASAIELKWIKELFPDEITTRYESEFDPGPKRVETYRIKRFRDMEIERKHESKGNPKAVGLALAKACLHDWFKPKSFDHSIRQQILRLNWICAAKPDLEFPPLDEKAVLNCLTRAFEGMTLAKQAIASNVKPAFRSHMPEAQWEWLDEFAPTTIDWPNDQPKKLHYPESPTDKTSKIVPVELHVKLHECFRLNKHPVICEGQQIVRFKLLTPKNKKIDFCDDWPTFKQREYPKIRKNLMAKFPGFGWV